MMGEDQSRYVEGYSSKQKTHPVGGGFFVYGHAVPKGIRTPATALKGP